MYLVIALTILNLAMMLLVWPNPVALFNAFSAGFCAFAVMVAFREGY